MTFPGHLLREWSCLAVWTLGVVDSPKKPQGSGAATPKEELLGDRVLTWHPRGEPFSKARQGRAKRLTVERHVLVDLLRGDNSLEKLLEKQLPGSVEHNFESMW